MLGLFLLFAAVFLLNLIPAFAPPTWMALSLLGLRYPQLNLTLFALVAATAATAGRLALAKLSRVIIRGRFLSDDTKRNIDAIRTGLEGRKKVTFGVFLFYAFSPFPSNYLFIAYGLTTMELRLIAAPFFLGRAISYSFWGHSAAAVARRVTMGGSDAVSYLSGYFILSQILLLYVVYLFTRVDWRALFVEKRLRRAPRPVPRPSTCRG
ncbi:MAG TPA: hypothetical protein VGS20_11980 [Candidatus Acidoferrales bacterium]|nr:hypothetical protein [Candidatus Acidoferrales bacterium]